MRPSSIRRCLLAGLSVLSAFGPVPARAADYPVTDKAIDHLPYELLLQLGALESLPYPALMPYPMPPGYVLSDVRVHYLPHAREGWPRSYTLVYASGGSADDRSFMLQSRLPGYSQSAGRCPGRVLATSDPLWLNGYSFEPQTLELVSPACSITGQALTRSALAPEQVQSLWQSLHWFLPLPFRAQGSWPHRRSPVPPFVPVFASPLERVQ